MSSRRSIGNTFHVTTVTDGTNGTNAFSVDLSNEMDSVACDRLPWKQAAAVRAAHRSRPHSKPSAQSNGFAYTTIAVYQLANVKRWRWK